MMSIPGIKGVEFGLGFDSASKLGSRFHDPIAYDGDYYRMSKMQEVLKEAYLMERI